jgi:hypothetical protein
MNKDELEAMVTGDAGKARVWMQAHGKFTAVLIAVVVTFIIGWVLFHK